MGRKSRQVFVFELWITEVSKDTEVSKTRDSFERNLFSVQRVNFKSP